MKVVRVLALILVIGVAAWMRWHRAAPAAVPPPSVSTTSASVSPPGTSLDRYDLARDERLGGHTLMRHVGRSDDDLRERLRREPDISAASTYTDRATAERVVAATLAREKRRVDVWVARQGSRPNLAIDYHGVAGDIIGRSIRRGGAASEPCLDALVVLRSSRNGGFIVLTTYPETR